MQSNTSRRRRRIAATVVVTGFAAGIAAAADRPVRDADVVPPRRAEPGFRFERNVGQADARWAFVAHGRGLTQLVGAGESEFLLPGGSVRLRFDAASPEAACMARGPLPGESRYLVGNDPTRWLRHVPQFAEVAVARLADGVDLHWRPSDAGNPEYDLVVAPGADAVGFRVEGGTTRIDADGALATAVPGGRLVQSRPAAYQDRGGERVPVEARFVAAGCGRFAFEIGRHDAALPVVIDPEIVYSSYLGGADLDDARYVAVDSAGAAYVQGTTISADFPSVPHMPRTFPGHASDVYVTKFSPDGTSLVWSTYVGGTQLEYPGGLCVDSTGRASAACRTQSDDFPLVAAAFPTAPNSGISNKTDAAVFRLDPNGANLEFSTYLGGTDEDVPVGVGLDPSGNLWVGGFTQSSDFPTAAPIQAQYGGGQSDMFLARFDAAGALVSSTTLGGPNAEVASSMAVSADGTAALAGYAVGTPTAAFGTGTLTIGPVTSVHNVAAVVVKPDGTLSFAAVVGGSKDEVGTGVALDAAGAVYVTGSTQSSDFPLKNPAMKKSVGSGAYAGSAFALKLAADGTLVYSTFLEASGGALLTNCLAVDSHGDAWIGGEVASYPATGEKDAPALLELSPAGDRVVRFDRMPRASGFSQILSVALTGGGLVQAAGRISNKALPGPRTVQWGYAGNTDGFVMRIRRAPVTAKRVLIKLDFARTGRDSIRVSGAFDGASLPPASSQATVDVGGVARTFTVDARGRGRSGADTIRFGYGRRGATFAVDLHGDFAAALADEGLTGGATVRGARRSADVTIGEGGATYAGTLLLSYTTKAGASGVAVLRTR